MSKKPLDYGALLGEALQLTEASNEHLKESKDLLVKRIKALEALLAPLRSGCSPQGTGQEMAALKSELEALKAKVLTGVATPPTDKPEFWK